MNFSDYPILYVDDEQANRVVMKHNLGKEFTLFLAESGSQALEILERENICVLLADQRMPGMTGVDLVERVRLAYPDIIRVIITAYSDLEATIDAINRGQVSRFVKKPWTREELSAILRESIQSFYNAVLVKRLQDRLMSLDRISAVGIMASSIAHDIRQPLTYIEPNLEMMQRDFQALASLGFPERSEPVVQRMAECLSDAFEGVKMLRVLSHTLLESLSNKPISKSMVDLKEIINGVLAITRSTVTRRARLKLEVPEGEIRLLGSSTRLSQLLINLLLNAVQAVEPGEPLKNQIVLRCQIQGGQIVIEVEDSGKGISPENQERIFNPFFTTKGQTGSGLGLTICKQAVQEHDGTIQLFSTLGKGSLFRVVLPWTRHTA
ncbi:MAG: hybrid sensor histidine kinase/response regulator [Bradymonadales bacterium]|nr:hybrid sensor histidine kinase/response regulator [Bradymonadales bacterium]